MSDVRPETRPLDAESRRRVREGQIALLYTFPQRQLGHVVNAAVVSAVVWDKIDHLVIVLWAALVVAVSAIRYRLDRAFHRRAEGGDVEKWGRYFTIGSTTSALLWGATSAVVWLSPEISLDVFIAFVIAGTCSAAAAMTYPVLATFYLFAAGAALPLAINFFLLSSQGLYLAMGVLTILLVILLGGQARATNRMLLRSLNLQEENRVLVAELSEARNHLEARVRERTAELDHASETLRAEMAARLETESRLQQAQKMEAIGQLTGGIAHDFNNLLAVIQGNAELLGEQLDTEAGRREIHAILRASERGAQLTQRLLAFSRKQTLQPEAVDINALIGSMTEMLGRTLGQGAEVEFVPEPGLEAARVDPGQLENAILNLAINARDAMGEGGKVRISTASVLLSTDAEIKAAGTSPQPILPGRYVVIAVTDTGIGIPRGKLDKVWEPFFTTKPAGQGTGLGLSMVYGFIQQSGGRVTIQSEVGKGTTVRLFLPCAERSEKVMELPGDVSGVPKGEEYIFVIEDDAEVRDLVGRYLHRLGYRVVVAAGAEEAFEKFAANGKPDLILSDVVLTSGHRGPAIVASVRNQLGPVRAIFMSGYAAGAFTDTTGLDGAILINKPFELTTLARRIRAALDAPEPS